MLRKILIIDDNEINRSMLNNILCRDYAVVEAASGEAALAILQREGTQFSAVLLDISMPGMDGYEVLHQIREDLQLSQIPVIMVTANEDDDSRVHSLALGASDFATKPYNPDIILHCLHNHIAFRESAETVNALRRDSLTALYTRESFFDKVRELVSAHESGYYVMACFDIDKFKVINDQYGTAKGDELLRNVAKIFREGFQPIGGVCSRIAADDFAVLYPKDFMNSDQIAQIHTKSINVEGLVFPVAYSIGRYVVDDITLSPAAMYDRAMLAVTSVKGRFDKKIAFYDKKMMEQIRHEQEIVSDMTYALESHQFEVWFQPQYNHASGAMIGSEALVRWRHPKKGLIPPDQFIQIFEQNGFIYELDKYIWEEVCRYLRRWLDGGLEPLPVSVNISRYDILRPDVVQVITGLIARYSIPVALLRLEVTESAFSDNTGAIIAVVRSLIAAGFTVEIDDFGSGYSSLNTLKDVPAQILKLDMRFFEKSDDSERGGNIVESVIRMAKWLGMSVIAEGVENRPQADYLCSIGCSYIQGYLYAKPMPVSAYEEHCDGLCKEEHLLALETVENLNNNAFWDPESMDSLIFSSYVGAACIAEYSCGRIELVRATKLFAAMFGDTVTIDAVLKTDWSEHMDEESKKKLRESLTESSIKNTSITVELVFTGLPVCPHKTYIRTILRVIAVVGERLLVYCMCENLTAQREAEDSLRESATQMQTFMNDTPGAFARMRLLPNGKLSTVFVNEILCQMRGMTREEILCADSENAMVAIHPDDVAPMIEMLQHMLTTGEKVQTKYRLRRSDGSYLSLGAYGRLTKDKFGDFYVNIYCTDLSASEKRDLSIREITPFVLSAIMKTSPNLDFVKDKDLNYLCCSPAFVAFTRQKCEADLIGKNDYDIWTKEEADHFRADDLRLFSGGESLVDYTEPIPSDDGIQHYCITSKYILRDSSGEIIGLYGTGRDVTNIRSAFDQLKLLTDSIPGGIAKYALTPQGIEMVYCNDGFCKMIGCSREEYEESIREGVTNRIFSEDLPGLMAQVQELYDHDTPINCSYRIKKLTGQGYLWLNMRAEVAERHAEVCYANVVFLDITTQIEAVQQKKQSSEQLQFVLDSVVSGICVSTVDGENVKYLFCNNQYYEIHGYTVEQFATEVTNVFDLFHPDDRAKIYAAAQNANKDAGSTTTIEYRIVRRDGQIRWIKTVISTHAMDGVDLPIQISVVSDITQEHQTKLKMQELNEKLQAIMENVSSGIVMSVIQNGIPEIVLSNDRYYELFGYTRELYHQSFAGKLGPILDSEAPAMLDTIETVMRTGIRTMVDFRAQHRSGKILWLRDRVTRVTIDAFACPVQLSVLYDVTEQKEAEEQLHQMDKELRIALQHSGTTFCRLDIPARTLYLSAEVSQAKELPEIIPDMPDGMLRLQKIHPESVAAYRTFIEEILCGGSSGSGVYRLMLPAGWRWIEAKYTTVFSASGKPSRAIISYQDITDKLEKEAVFNRWQQYMRGKSTKTYSLFKCDLNKNLSYDFEDGELLHSVFDIENASFNVRARIYAAQRVFPEDREQYIAFANSDAMLASYARDTKIATLEYRELVAGEVRWLRLTVELVQSMESHNIEAYLLYEDIDEAKKAELATQAKAEADSLTGLLNRAAFERACAARLTGRRDSSLSAMLLLDIDGFKLINDTYGHATGDETLIEFGTKLKENFGEKDLLCRLGGDEFIVYMPTVSHISAVKDKAALLCALLHKSFSLEIQLSVSIGIAICPANGTTFEHLYRNADIALYHVKKSGKDSFAIFSDEMGEKATLVPALSQEADATQPAGEVFPKRRMLIVEDNEINRDCLCALFDQDFIVETAAGGTAALVKLKRYGAAISIVLLDLKMPGVDGFAVLRQMRESVSIPPIPVIVVSGMDEREFCLRAIREGATDYITKPVDGDLLKLRVAAALGKADNEQLRARNRLLAIQNEEAKRITEARRHSEELTLALNEAERADIAKTQFLSSMSHEIRTPLNAVIGYNTIARQEMAAAKTEAESRQAGMKVMDCLTKSEVASKHLLTIINDVLDMSAIESGKLKVDNAPFDFRGLISSLTVMFFSQAKAKGVNFEVCFDKPTDEWLRGDQLRINQILTNLLSNAVKFTPEGGSVSLSIKEQSLDDTHLGFRFVISDTGIGMTPEYLTHIWTPFEQAESSIARRFGGSGLGLSITKNLVDLMGGSISVESTSGVGSKFTVDLSLLRTQQPVKNTIHDFSKINALICDDDPSTCDYIRLLFDRCGAHCMSFTSGAKAVEAFAAAQESGTPFTMCMIDWRMPRMSGYSTITEIRRLASAMLPVVVVTAYDFSEISEHAQELGINKFISKPLFQSSLFDLLSTVSGIQPPTPQEQAPKYDFGGVRVLLVEDNNMNMEVAKHVLMSAKLAVDCAWNGQEAIDIFLSSRPGTYLVILMDVHMPEVDGYQATRIIRKSLHPDAKNIPIIAMTADAFTEDIAEAHAAGMNGHIAKPVDVEALLHLLSTYKSEHDRKLQSDPE